MTTEGFGAFDQIAFSLTGIFLVLVAWFAVWLVRK